MKIFDQALVFVVCLTAAVMIGCGSGTPVPAVENPPENESPSDAEQPSDSAAPDQTPAEEVTPSEDTTAQDDEASAAAKDAFENAEAELIDGQKVTVPGIFTIDAVPGGYLWTEMEMQEVAPGQMARMFLCNKEGTKDAMILIVIGKPCKESGKRIALLKGQYNGAITQLNAMGFSDLQGTKPPIEGEIPDLVEFEVSGVTPDGSRTIFKHGARFSPNFTFQATVISPGQEVRKAMFDTFTTMEMK